MKMDVRFPGGARVDVAFGAHTVRTDQSRPQGGEESAPTPFATFLASIAACAGVYVLGFCRQRGLPTDGIRMVQEVDVNDAGMVGTVRLDIHLPPGFPEKYRSALIRAAEQCAVKRHLEHPPRFVITSQGA